MIHVFSMKGCKKLDEIAVTIFNIPSIILMENAAISVFNNIKDKYERFIVICGKGNNGGDGLALCRHLVLAEKKVKLIIVSSDQKYSENFNVNYNALYNLMDKDNIEFIKKNEDICKNTITTCSNKTVIIDALFGVGLSRKIDGVYKKIIDRINDSLDDVISVDVPSGLNSDTGEVNDVAVKANITYTFEVMKKGFLEYSALDYTGKVEILDIGIPSRMKIENSEGMFILDKVDCNKILPKRSLEGHKGDYGKSLIYAGSKGFTGASYITTECSIRSGAGLVTLICSEDIFKEMSIRVTEAMTVSIYDTKRFEKLLKNANSIAVGPGIGINEESIKTLEKIILLSNCPIVIDADAINIISKRSDILEAVKNRGIFTPHPGEMARFLNKSIDEIEKNRIKITRDTAKKYKCIFLLKGYNTVISDGTNVFINPTGNSKMASGGMGDALTGIINGLISQGISPLNATILGAYIHGDIADEIGKDSYIVNARDIIKKLPNHLNKLLN